MSVLKAKRRLESMKDSAAIGTDERWALNRAIAVIEDECAEMLVAESVAEQKQLAEIMAEAMEDAA